MDFQQSKKLLDKINALHQSISFEEENISSIERDLMLSYIRQFYESFLNTQPETLSDPERNAIKKAKIKKEASTSSAEEYAPPPKVKIPEPVKEIEFEVTPPPPPPPPPPPVVKEEPRVEVPQPPKATPAPKSAPSGKFRSLFDNKEASELSEKLSLQPISDINKAIAINDKLLYVNDLFGKDPNAYSAAMIRLNNFNTMDEARDLLEQFAQSHDWLEEEKQDTARAFIKIVRRRYI